MGNICRSPAAEIVFRQMVFDAGMGDCCEIDSAGTVGYQTGNPPDTRMAEKLRSRGYEVTGSARKVRSGDLERFDLILTMDVENQADMLRMEPSEKQRARIVPFVTYLRNHSAARIPDPYYGGENGFAEVIELVEDGCAGLLDEFLEKSRKIP